MLVDIQYGAYTEVSQAKKLVRDSLLNLNLISLAGLAPTFTGCPSGVNPSFPLNEGSNQADIDLVITATDQSNRQLPLTVTDGLQFPSTIAFTEDYRLGKPITILAVDNEGRNSTCSFLLRIFGKLLNRC